MHDADAGIAPTGSAGTAGAIEIDGKIVFLIPGPCHGTDFTFFLRHTEEVPRLLRAIAGSADPDAPEKRHYSGRAWVLVARVDEADLLTEPGPGGQPQLRRRLAKSSGSSPDRLVKMLRARLKAAGCAGPPKPGDLVTALNAILDRGAPALDPLPRDSREATIVHRIGDDRVARRVRKYLRLCAHPAAAIRPLEMRLREGRILAARSYEGKVWSVSFRTQKTTAGFEPDVKPGGKNLNSIEDLCTLLFEETFTTVNRCEHPPVPRAAGASPRAADTAGSDAWQASRLSEIGGLVVVAGATNSAKSLVTRGLIHLYLQAIKPAGNERTPHLVTFEDPIEKYYAAATHEPASGHAQLAVVMSADSHDIDYTPRQTDIDAPSLQKALHDALRQTPKVFFVGETRTDRDWKTLLDFAATGHLVVTTTHAGSLTEAIRRIFLALKVQTPADRNQVASRLLAVVHLRRATVAGHKEGILLPAVWRRVPRAVNTLTAEGLAAVLPHSHSADGDPCNCLGRKYFSKRLLKAARRHGPLKEGLAAQLIGQATGWDLVGV